MGLFNKLNGKTDRAADNGVEVSKKDRDGILNAYFTNNSPEGFLTLWRHWQRHVSTAHPTSHRIMKRHKHGKSKLSPVERELHKIEREEEKLTQNAKKQDSSPGWKSKLEGKIPEKTLAGLKKAFSKGFSVIFEKGSVLIEKTYDRDSIEKDFQINDYAMDVKGGRKEIGRIRSGVSKNNILNTVFTAVEGVGLGALGIGLPDIVIWVGILLRGAYETALKYGFDYDSPEEKLFILKMIETAMLSGEDWIAANEDVNQFILQTAHAVPGDDEMKGQIEKTADAFATEMLVTKFVQGLPVVGMFGGAANPVYYRRIMRYVQLKYRKRYLMGK